MRQGIGRTAPPRQSVVGRKYAADEGDQGQSMLPVIAECVDVPPGVAVRRDGRVKARSVHSAAAASRPDKAAIGTPGPGCVLPPARYSPVTRVREPGRRNEAIQPWDAGP